MWFKKGKLHDASCEPDAYKYMRPLKKLHEKQENKLDISQDKLEILERASQYRYESAPNLHRDKKHMNFKVPEPGQGAGTTKSLKLRGTSIQSQIDFEIFVLMGPNSWSKPPNSGTKSTVNCLAETPLFKLEAVFYL